MSNHDSINQTLRRVYDDFAADYAAGRARFQTDHLLDSCSGCPHGGPENRGLPPFGHLRAGSEPDSGVHREIEIGLAGCGGSIGCLSGLVRGFNDESVGAGHPRPPRCCEP